MQITKDKFEDMPLKTMGTDVDLERVEFTEDFRGEKSASIYGPKESIRVIFKVRNQSYEARIMGNVKLAPAFMLSKVGDSVKKGDKVTVGTETWEVFSALNRNDVFIYSELFLLDDTKTDKIVTSPGGTAGIIAPRE